MNTDININKNGKLPLNVLLRKNTRELLSKVYEDQYKQQYHSFSIFIEELILIAFRELEVIE